MRQTTLRPLLRWFAVWTFFVWIGAQALCQTHCSFSACHDESGEATCHADKSSDSQHGDEKTPDHQDDSDDVSCNALKTILSEKAASPLTTPVFSVLYTLAPLTLTSDEINALIATDPDLQPLKGKLYVTLENEHIKGQLSVSMDEAGLPMFRGRYLNGSGTFSLSLRNGILRLTAQEIAVKGKPLPE